MIRKIKEMNVDSNLVYILPLKGEKNTLTAKYGSFVESFQKSEREIDFIKTGNAYAFFIQEQADMEKMRVAGYKIRKLLDKKADKLVVVGDGEAALALTEGIILANYQFLKYFNDKQDKEYALKEVSLYGDLADEKIEKLNNTLKAVYWARDMVNEPVCYLTAERLATEIQQLGDEAGFNVKVFNGAEIEQLGMGGLLAVNKGSIDPPTFTVMEYKPQQAVNAKPIVLVGKGIVFDTGGLSLKPTLGSMDSMKSDMGGAACMIGTLYAAALNKLNVHIIGLIPATDNRPGQKAYTPGDIIKMYDGTTVEVLNTDAEGRMILADAIAYANQYEPELIIDAATLTGAALIVAGNKASCIMGNANQEVMDQLIQSGEKVHERLVQLPFWDDFKDQLKSTVADLKNVGGRNAGTITAGKFLEHFAKYPYVHLDIAGPAFLEEAQDYKGIGGTGVGIRTLVDFLSKH